MAELLFIATTIFVAYVVFDVVGRKKHKPDTQQATDKTITKPEPITPDQKTSPLSQTVMPVTKVAVKPKKAANKKTPAAATTTNTLKNPKTGEVAKMPNNYAFAKRWIKEALVAEGLLDKIYKNNEIDANATAKIQDALQQLKAMDKYQ